MSSRVESGHGTNNAVVAIAVELMEPMGFGQIRMRHIENASGTNLDAFVCDAITKERLYTLMAGLVTMDCLTLDMSTKGLFLSTSGDPAHIAMLGVHRVASLLKCWILGIGSARTSSIRFGRVHV